MTTLIERPGRLAGGRRMATTAVVLLAISTSAYSAPLNATLGMTTLPSAQGWSFTGDIAEATAFSVGGGHAYYGLTALDPSLPFEMTMRARVFEGFGEWLHMYAETATHTAVLGISSSCVAYDSGVFFTILAGGLDNSVFREFRLVGTPNVSAQCFSTGHFSARSRSTPAAMARCSSATGVAPALERPRSPP